MEEIVIRPYEGVGPIDFGDSPEQVEQKLGPPRRRRRNKTSGGGTASFVDPDLKVGFDTDDECEFVEIYSRWTAATVGDMPIKGRAREVGAALRGKGFEVRLGDPPGDQEHTYYCDELGIVFAPDPDVDPEQIDTVLAWRRGYWERYAPASETSQ